MEQRGAVFEGKKRLGSGSILSETKGVTFNLHKGTFTIPYQEIISCQDSFTQVADNSLDNFCIQLDVQQNGVKKVYLIRIENATEHVFRTFAASIRTHLPPKKEDLRQYYGIYSTPLSLKVVYGVTQLAALGVFALVILNDLNQAVFPRTWTILAGVVLNGLVLLSGLSLFKRAIKITEFEIVFYTLSGDRGVPFQAVTKFVRHKGWTKGGTKYTLYYTKDAQEQQISFTYRQIDQANKLLRVLRQKVERVPQISVIKHIGGQQTEKDWPSDYTY